MTENTNNTFDSLTDAKIIEMVGAFIKHTRLQQNKSQAKLAEEAGINRWTLSQLENGNSINLSTLIQLLRVLGLLHLLEIFQIKYHISPVEYAKLREKERKRASKTDKKDYNNETEIPW